MEFEKGDKVKVIDNEKMRNHWGKNFEESVGKTLTVTTEFLDSYLLNDNYYHIDFTDDCLTKPEITNWEDIL